jgi:hypothetical protein
MQQIAIFYHIYAINNWREIFNEQFDKIVASGLYHAAEKIHVGVIGDLPEIEDSKISFRRNLTHNSEADTLLALWQYCQANPQARVLYFHCKGVSHYEQKNGVWKIKDGLTVDSWRRYLDYVVLEQWQHCVNKLDLYDCAATEWLDHTLYDGKNNFDPHYSGNFWWARASYVAKLDPRLLYGSNYTQCEKWISTGSPTHYSLWSSGRNCYYDKIQDHEYRTISLK